MGRLIVGDRKLRMAAGLAAVGLAFDNFDSIDQLAVDLSDGYDKLAGEF